MTPRIAGGASATGWPVAAGTHPPRNRLPGLTRCLLLVIAVRGLPVAASPPADPLVFYDMTAILEWERNDPQQLRAFWDHAHLVTSLQGLVNRHEPRLFVRYIVPPDDFCASLEGPVSVQVEYGDMGTGSFVLEYDSRDPSATLEGAYKASEVIERRGTLRWLRHTFRLPDPRFSGRQNGEADLRIATRGDDLLVRRVVVRRDEP